MSAQKFLTASLALICALLILTACKADARYLPTRSNSDTLDKLRELLREIGNEAEREEYQPDSPPRWHPETKLFYKREIPAKQ